MPNIVKGHYLQHRCFPALLHNSQWFNIKAAMAHHPIIWKELDELLAKATIKLSIGGPSFYSNILVVPMHTSGLQFILNLQWFNLCMHILLRYILSNLINTTSMLPLVTSKKLIYIFLLLSITVAFGILFGNTNLTSGRFCYMDCLQSLQFSLHLLNPYCSLA